MTHRYEFVEEIGRGGLGVVYRARDAILKREVAVKQLHLDSKKSAEQLTEDLIREAKTLSSLNHPNIVTVHDAGETPAGPFIVMELLQGETLEERVKRNKLSLDEFEELATQSLEGLAAAQSANLLHRDIKPANIMLVSQPDDGFQVKILDFGLATMSLTPSIQTMDHDASIFGSIFFMAPEQFECKPLDGRTDLYSLGCIFYYALTGQYPCKAETAPAVIMAHMQHRIVPLSFYRPDVPAEVVEWIDQLMARDIENRPANAIAALEAWHSLHSIDEKQLREVSSGDPGIARQLSDEFARECRQLLVQITQLLDHGGAVSAIRSTAQSIRGTAATLGFTEIQALALEIEQHCDSNPDETRRRIALIEKSLERLQDQIARVSWTS